MTPKASTLVDPIRRWKELWIQYQPVMSHLRVMWKEKTSKTLSPKLLHIFQQPKQVTIVELHNGVEMEVFLVLIRQDRHTRDPQLVRITSDPGKVSVFIISCS
jgi:hypothetical protein